MFPSFQAELDLTLINWPFVGGVFLAKASVFALVMLASLAFDIKLDKGHRLIQGGLRGKSRTTPPSFSHAPSALGPCMGPPLVKDWHACMMLGILGVGIGSHPGDPIQ